MEMGRSNPVPSFRMSAGARLTVTWVAGERVAGVADGGPNPVFALPDRCIRQSDRGKMRNTVGYVHFHVHQMTVDTDDRGPGALDDHNSLTDISYKFAVTETFGWRGCSRQGIPSLFQDTNESKVFLSRSKALKSALTYPACMV